MSFFLIHQSKNIEMNSKHWRQPEKITFGGRRLYLTWRFLKQRMPHPSCRFSDDSRPTYDSVIERIDSRGGICLAVDASGHVQAPAPRCTCRSIRAVCWRLMSARRLNFDWRLTRQRRSTRALSARGSSSLVVSAARHNNPRYHFTRNQQQAIVISRNFAKCWLIFKKKLTGTLSSRFAIRLSLQIWPHFKCVACDCQISAVWLVTWFRDMMNKGQTPLIRFVVDLLGTCSELVVQHFDLLWICCGFVADLLWTSCTTFQLVDVVDFRFSWVRVLIKFDLIYNVDKMADINFVHAACETVQTTCLGLNGVILQSL